MSESYILDHYSVLENQYHYIERLTSSLNPHNKRLFNHILASTIIQAKRCFGWIPVWSVLIQAKLPNAKSKELEKAGLVSIKAKNEHKGLSQEFKVKDEIVEEFLRLDPLRALDESGIAQYNTLSKVNLFTGKPLKSVRQSITRDKHRKAEPQHRLIYDAIKTFQTCYFNQSATLKHLQEKEQEYKNLPEGSKQHVTLKYRFLNDYYCFSAIMNQGPTPTENTSIYAFTPVYEPQKTGRISWALQSATRPMKEALYKDVSGLFNYDLKSSQAAILHEEMKRAGVDCEWLSEFLTKPQVRKVYADITGVLEDTWKRCFYALVMGGNLPDNILYSSGKLKEHLQKDRSVTEENLVDVYRRFKTTVAPFMERLEDWHTYLLDEYARDERYITKSGGKTYVKNACNMRLSLEKLQVEQRYKQVADLAAHILQGREACFIHNLTILGEEYGFKPIGNEHDGLIVIGRIPNEAIESAKAKAGLSGIEFIEKPFYTPEGTDIVKQLKGDNE